jgi:hypothetical protein
LASSIGMSVITPNQAEGGEPDYDAAQPAFAT